MEELIEIIKKLEDTVLTDKNIKEYMELIIKAEKLLKEFKDGKIL